LLEKCGLGFLHLIIEDYNKVLLYDGLLKRNIHDAFVIRETDTSRCFGNKVLKLKAKDENLNSCVP